MLLIEIFKLQKNCLEDSKKDTRIRKFVARTEQRINAENEQNLRKFFDEMKQLIEKEKFGADQIHNVDESPFLYDLTLKKVTLFNINLILKSLN